VRGEGGRRFIPRHNTRRMRLECVAESKDLQTRAFTSIFNFYFSNNAHCWSWKV